MRAGRQDPISVDLACGWSGFVTLGSMNSPSGTSRDWNSDAAAVRAEALEVLSDALQWRLAGSRWPAIDEVLATMDAALRVNDLVTLAAATADLELVGPVRITRIGATPVVPAPAPVRERLNRLVHVLGGTAVPGREEAERAGPEEPGLGAIGVPGTAVPE
jgi:hypothetical protein